MQTSWKQLLSTGGRVLSSCNLGRNFIHLEHSKQAAHRHNVNKENINFKILSSYQTNSNNQTNLALDNIAIGNIETNDVEVDVLGERMVFNQTWLRDNCHCPNCTHQHSRQRLFTIRDFRREMFTVSQVKLTSSEQIFGPRYRPSEPHDKLDPNALTVKWIDGHESTYSLGWLRYITKLYDRPRISINSNGSGLRRLPFVFPQDDFYKPIRENNILVETWNVEDIKSKLKPVKYSDLIDGFNFNDDPKFINSNSVADMSPRRFEAIWNTVNQLVTFGLTKIIDVPQERNQVLRVVRSLAYERPTGYGTVFDVVVEPNEEKNLAYSTLEFDLHSDLTYRETSPGTQLLHCIRNSMEGGLSYFSDGFRAALELKQNFPELFEVLVQYPATFVVADPYRDVKFRRHNSVITLDNEENLKELYYSPYMLPPVGSIEDVKLFYIALDKFTTYLQSKQNKFIEKMDPGDLYLFHNRRVLHGRSAYNTSTSSRFLQGCYMDWDEVECLREKLFLHKRVVK